MESVTVGLGILIGLVWNRRTGWSCGGTITPGLLALYAGEPYGVALALALGVALTVLLTAAARLLSLYGKERVGAAMLLALLARAGWEFFISPAPLNLHWIGWVVPGLIAADCDRQGIGMTLCGALSCTLVTSFCVILLKIAATR
jgi:poly-gamma-glutamate biosynthesis protein PgsC/CapC